MEMYYLLDFCKKGKAIIWVVDENKIVYKIQKLDDKYANIEDLKNNKNGSILWEEIEKKIKSKEWKIAAFTID
ncbi:MAG: hypothetical protein ACO2O4_00440 [Minisyncoccia bacterium]|jgi:hypothetical protein